MAVILSVNKLYAIILYRTQVIKGSFFVETTNNTYYWLKDMGEMVLNAANNGYYYPEGKGEKDFEFDGYSRFVLTDYGPVHALPS